MEFSIIKGEATAEELMAIEHAISLHKREESVPVILKSTFGRPQLRKPLNKNFRFGRSN
ncbi:unannotated protein [freshwater metagenome]|uniref:Unannotated protein n=1 Tax=freshwater metagenome TaxID=449393 RepID=A0A6J6KPR8_9ZZZZ